MRKFIYALVFLAVLHIFTTSRVLACSGFTAPFWKAFTSSTAVFSGKIVNFEKPSTFRDPKVTFHVLKSWKGPKDEFLVVTSTGYRIACGNAFEDPSLGGTDTFLVYAYGDENNLSTTTFGRTRNLSTAGEDVLKLNAITNPVLWVTISLAIGLAVIGTSRYLVQKMKFLRVNQVQ